MLDGDLVGDSADLDATIPSREARATIEASKAMAAKYDTDADEDAEDADDAAFAQFLADEFGEDSDADEYDVD